MPTDQLLTYVAALSGSGLMALRAELGYEPADLPVREAVVAELAQRAERANKPR